MAIFFMPRLKKAIFGYVFFILPTMTWAQTDIAPAKPEILDQSQNQDADSEVEILKDPFKSALPRSQIDGQQTTTAVGIDILTQPTPEEELDLSQFHVTGLVWGQAAPKAIINDAVYGIGSVVGGAKIMRIDKEGILLLFGEKQYLLERSGVGAPESPKAQDSGIKI